MLVDDMSGRLREPVEQDVISLLPFIFPPGQNCNIAAYLVVFMPCILPPPEYLPLAHLHNLRPPRQHNLIVTTS
jgi:hypothetical protein